MKPQTEQHLQLCQQLTAAEHAYYGLDKPIMTDAEYDRLFRQLIDLELAHPEFKSAHSPTARVGGTCFSGFAKVKHLTPMLSLDNAFSAEEVWKFFRGKVGLDDELVAEPKIDGLSLEVTYKNGQLYQAVTRGRDGVGDIVTENARTIRSLPLVIPDLLDIRVRGEVYMPISVFEKLNAHFDNEDDKFANPRNAASGTMKSHDPKVVAERHLEFIAYTYMNGPCVGHNKNVKELGRLGFRTPAHIPTKDGKTAPMQSRFTFGKGESFIQDLIDVLDKVRKTLDFETDGLVFKINNTELQSELGEGTHSPRWAVAYKYPAEQKPTKLLDIVLTVGRTGQITPNAVLEPIQLGGSTIKAASLCNADEIKRLRIGIGDMVAVQKSGEIIPKVVGNVSGYGRAPFWKMPANCPTCGTKLIKPGVHHFCPNEECPDRVKGQLLHAVSKGALDIDGCGEAVIETMYSAGIRDLIGLVSGGWLPLRGAVRERVYDGIEAAKSQPLWRKIYALGIEGVGTTASKTIARHWPNFKSMRMVCLTDMEKVLGKVVGNNLYSWLVVETATIQELESLGFKFSEECTTGPLTGKSFVITGKLETGTRDEVGARIEAAGGTLQNGVRKDTNYLVTNDNGSGSTKCKQAAQWGIGIINEQQLLKMIGGK